MRILKKEICLSIALFPIVFVAAGVLFIVSGYFSYQEYNKGIEVSAVVSKCEYDMEIDIDDNMPYSSYDIYLNYSYNDVEYENIYWYSQTNAMKVGESVTIMINPDMPTKAIVAPSWDILIVGGGFAICGMVLSFIMIPSSVSQAEIIGKETAPHSKSKKRYLFALIPVIPAIVFSLLGIYSSMLFYIGVIVFLYFTVVVYEILKG